jgi:hypothetical protein
MPYRPTREIFTLCTLAALALGGCGDDDSINGTPGDECPGFNANAFNRTDTFHVAVNGLRPLDAGKGHYEAWVAFPLQDEGKQAPAPGSAPLHGDAELISIGKFRVTGTNTVVGLDGTPPEWALRLTRNLRFAEEAWISIEAEGDQDTIPGGLLLAGQVTGVSDRGTACLDASYRSIWDRELSDLPLASLAGTYTIETPSDTIASNAGHGLYWRNGAAAGLASLPRLDGVRILYEGWIEEIATQTFHSTGRFTMPDTLDSDGPGAGVAVTGATPRFPGQEFTAATEETLSAGGYRALVTLEPTIDNDPARPTQFVLLRGTIPADSVGAPIAMENATVALPTAFIVINR